ncbi:MAG: HAMP domain-containing sensor histidine kinase [Thermodesulfobacteriota bacterium]
MRSLQPHQTIVLGYLLAAGAWIALSDLAVALIAASPATVGLLQTMKGWGFVLATGSVLYWLLRQHRAEQERATRAREAGLRSANRELERRVRERTAELESFVHSVTHDLRAPLRAMEGFAQALVEDCGAQLDDAGREYARRIAASASTMDALIRELLDYSRLSREDVRPEELPLGAVLRAAVAKREDEIRQRGATVEIAEPLPAVRAPGALLLRVVTNLLDNALKFVAPGTVPRVRVWALAEGGRVRLWIADNGIGVPPEHRERIFRVFERLHGVETYPGLGMGLAYVQKAVERMGGTAGMEPEPGGGSRFWLEVPGSPPGNAGVSSPMAESGSRPS